MMKNSKLKFSEYVQKISGSKSFGRFVLIVAQKKMLQAVLFSFWLRISNKNK